MNKSKSYPVLSEDVVQPMRKSRSLSELNESDYYFEEFFEGDGPLGITFSDIDGRIVVKKIQKGSVASETYGLNTMMELVNVNNYDVGGKNYEKIMKKINKSWDENNRVYLKFKKQFYSEISISLDTNKLLQYYDQFVELGAKEKIDFEYIEMGDLIKMGMIKDEITRFKNINPNI
jgi:hypothetical protein